MKAKWSFAEGHPRATGPKLAKAVSKLGRFYRYQRSDFKLLPEVEIVRFQRNWVVPRDYTSRPIGWVREVFY